MKMYDEAAEWLIYQPPKSVSFGHQSRPRNARKAWSLTKSFLEEFTHYELGHHRDLTCLALGESDEPIDQTIMQNRIQVARSLFGPETGHPRYQPSWNLTETLVESAIEFALDDDKFPKMPHGPTRFHFHYRFLWSEYWQASSGLGTLDGFDGSRNCFSNLGVTIGGQRIFLQPMFVFPGSWQSPEIRFFLEKIELKAPFRFRDQYFKRSLHSESLRSFGAIAVTRSERVFEGDSLELFEIGGRERSCFSVRDNLAQAAGH